MSELRISPFSVKFIISLTVTLSGDSGLTDLQNVLLSAISFGSKFEKYCFLAFRRRFTHKLRCFLYALWEATFLSLRESLRNFAFYIEIPK